MPEERTGVSDACAALPEHCMTLMQAAVKTALLEQLGCEMSTWVLGHVGLGAPYALDKTVAWTVVIWEAAGRMTSARRTQV